MIEHSGILCKKGLSIPQFCVLEVLEKCLLKCKMCGNWKCGDNPEELNIEEWKRFLTGLNDKFGNKIELNFTGGEPLMKNGILKLVSFAVRLGFKAIMVSNGYLIDEDKARQIAESGLHYLGLSLDSLSEDTHDFVRGMPGTYNRLMQAVEYLDRFKKNNLCVGIQTIIMKNNLKEILALTDWVQQDKRLESIYFQAIVQPNFSSLVQDWFTDNEWYKHGEFNFLWPEDTKEVHFVLDELIRLKKKDFKIANPFSQLEAFKAYFSDPQEFNQKVRCNKGKRIFSISPTGDMHLCHMYEKLGNIRDTGLDLKKMWHSELANETRSKMNHCSKYCGPLVNCYFE